MPDAAQHPPSDKGALRPFRHPVFRAVWLASMGSNFGGYSILEDSVIGQMRAAGKRVSSPLDFCRAFYDGTRC